MPELEFDEKTKDSINVLFEALNSIAPTKVIGVIVFEEEGPHKVIFKTEERVSMLTIVKHLREIADDMEKGYAIHNAVKE